MKKIIPLALIVAIVAVIAWLLLFWNPQPSQQENVLLEVPTGGDFVLDSADGPVALQDFRGNVVLLYFGYTWCPDICPTSLAYQSLALKELTDDERAHVQSIFISVDPERDTLAKLKEYVYYFHPGMLGLTGKPENIAKISKQYGAAYRIVKMESETDYIVDHSASTYIIDKAGELSQVLAHGTPPQDILVEIRKTLNQ